MMKLRRKKPTATVEPASAQLSAERDLAVERDRLVERFAVMQSELGGLFYEMAIRDHVRMDVLIPRAAALQRVDAELGQLERMLADRDASVGGSCPACGVVYARGATFCSHCGKDLTSP